jgi:hypothetical protein
MFLPLRGRNAGAALVATDLLAHLICHALALSPASLHTPYDELCKYTRDVLDIIMDFRQGFEEGEEVVFHGTWHFQVPFQLNFKAPITDSIIRAFE